jgi:hypothetical protein
MKIHGYKDEGLPIEQIEPYELAEITIEATRRNCGRSPRSCARRPTIWNAWVQTMTMSISLKEAKLWKVTALRGV